MLGSGAFSSVEVCAEKKTMKEYAVKVCTHKSHTKHMFVVYSLVLFLLRPYSSIL